MSNIDTMLTHQVLLGVKYVDLNKALDDAEVKLESLKSLLKNNADDKNVKAVVQLYETQFKQFREQIYDYMIQVGISPHRSFRAVVLIEEITEEEE